MARNLTKRQRLNQKKKQKKLLLKQGYSEKEINRLSSTKISKISKDIISQITIEKKKDEARKKKKDSAERLFKKKYWGLQNLGIDPSLCTRYRLKKVKLKDIESGNISRENYPFLFSSYEFDFDKVYHYPEGIGLALRFRDYTEENGVNELMMTYDSLENETLITILEGIVNQPKTYNKNAPNNGVGTSSGRAGTMRSSVTDEKTAQKMIDSDNDKVKKGLENEKRKRVHTGYRKLWQSFTQNGSPIISSMTGHECLVMLNSVMYNITEDDRYTYYNGLYKNIVNFIPDFKVILPKPIKEK